MTIRILAQMDFSAGINAPRLQVPAMKATVTLDNDEVFKGYDDPKKEKVILQKLTAVAVESLQASAKAFKKAIEEFDKIVKDKPPAGDKAPGELEKTLKVLCNQIVNAQEAKAAKAVEDEWAIHQKRDKALTKMNLKFTARIVLNAISLAASVTVAALSMGTLAVTLLGAAKTVLGTVDLINDFAKSRDEVAQEIRDADLVLQKDYEAALKKAEGKGGKGKAAAVALAEILRAAGTPFVKTVGKQEDKLDAFLGKSARLDREAQTLFIKANDLMAKIKNAEAGQLSDIGRAQVKKMGEKTAAVLDSIGKLRGSIDSDNAFYKAYKARTQTFKDMNGKALSNAATFVRAMSYLQTIATTAKGIVEIALKLA